MPLGSGPPRSSPWFEWPDVLVNICLYLPLGLILARDGVRITRLAALCALVSGTIELLQATVIPGRRGSPADVVTNLAGALAGFGLYSAARHLRRSRVRGRLVAAGAVAALPVCCWAVSGVLLGPSPPATESWWGQWAHRLTGMEQFRGSIVSVSFLGRPMPDNRLDSTGMLRDEARAGALSLDITFLSGGITRGPTELAGVADGNGNFVISLEQLGDDLLISWWSRGAALGLHPPRVAISGAVRAAPGERLRLRASVTGSWVRTSVERADSIHANALRLTPLIGWMNLISAHEILAGAQPLFNLLWMLGCVGYLILAVRVLRTFAGG